MTDTTSLAAIKAAEAVCLDENGVLKMLSRHAVARALDAFAAEQTAKLREALEEIEKYQPDVSAHTAARNAAFDEAATCPECAETKASVGSGLCGRHYRAVRAAEDAEKYDRSFQHARMREIARAALSDAPQPAPHQAVTAEQIRAVIEANWSSDTKGATAEAVLALFNGTAT